MEWDKKVTRVELIDEKGRRYAKWNREVHLSYQDNNRTLKVFVRKRLKSAEAVDINEDMRKEDEHQRTIPKG